MSDNELTLGVIGVIFGSINTAIAIHRREWSAVRGWVSTIIMTLAWMAK